MIKFPKYESIFYKLLRVLNFVFLKLFCCLFDNVKQIVIYFLWEMIGKNISCFFFEFGFCSRETNLGI